MSPYPAGPRFGAWQALSYAHSPCRFLVQAHARYGDPFTVRVPMPTVMTGHPEGIRQIFSAPLDSLRVDMPKSLKRILGEHDLRTLDGEAHRRARKQIAPGFHGESLKGLGELVHQTIVDTMEGWRAGAIMDMHDAMHDVTLDVILKTVFGIRLRENFGPLRVAVEELAAGFGSLAFMFCAGLGLNHDYWPPNRRVDMARQCLADLLLADIAERRAQGTAGVDILSRLMAARLGGADGFTDARLVDSLLTNLIAGRAGTGMLLAWVFAWLGYRPEVAEHLQWEIDGLGRDDDIPAITELPYLDAMLKECLRIHPELPAVTRTLAKPLEIRGYEIPANTHVAACAAVLHMDPELYPEPALFRPERFLERSYSGFEYIPFGGGYKLCVGNHFAMLQVKIMLTVLFSRGRFTPLHRGPIKIARRGLLIGPASVRVRFEPRR